MARKIASSRSYSASGTNTAHAVQFTTRVLKGGSHPSARTTGTAPADRISEKRYEKRLSPRGAPAKCEAPRMAA